MSGTGWAREQRGVIPQPIAMPGAVDLPSVRGAESIRAAGAQQAKDFAAVTDLAERTILPELRKASAERGEAEAAAEPLQRDAEGNLRPPDLSRPVFSTASGEAARQVRISRYGSELILQGQEQVFSWRREAQDNPAQFLHIAEGGRDGMLSRIPEGPLRTVVGERLTQLTTQHYGHMLDQQRVRERAEAEARATQAVRIAADDVLQRALAGTDFRESQQGVLAQIAAHQAAGTLDPARAVALEREVTVLMPAQAAVVRATRGGTSTAVGAALAGGPGTPGWRPEWAALTQEERVEMARYSDSLAGRQRATVGFGLQMAAEGRRASNDQAQADLYANRQGAALGPDGRLTGEALIREQEILGRLRQSNPAAWARLSEGTDTRARAERARAQEASFDQARIERALAGQPVDSRTGDPIDPRLQDLLRRSAGMSLSRQADLLEADARETEAQARVLQRRAEGDERFSAALAGFGAPVERNQENLDRASRFIAGAQNPLSATVQMAEQGLLPPAFVTAFRRTPETVEQMRQMTELFEAARAAPGGRALQNLRTLIGDRAFAAYEHNAEAMTQLSRPQDAPRLEEVRQQIGQTLTGQGRAPDQVRQELGAGAAEQRARLDELQGAAMQQQRGPGWLQSAGALLDPTGMISSGAVPPMPAEMRAQVDRAFWRLAPHYPTAEAAMNRAVADVMPQWGVSSTTIGGPNGMGGASPDGQRLVQHPAEQHVVPDGRSGAPSAAWQAPFARHVARESGLPETVATGLRLGTNAFWQAAPGPPPPPGQSPRYMLMVQRPELGGRSGAVMPLGVSGRTGGRARWRGPSTWPARRRRAARHGASSMVRLSRSGSGTVAPALISGRARRWIAPSERRADG